MEQLWNTIRNHIRSWHEWQIALTWAEVFHPSWAHLATQIGRPEIRKTYRRKILREYCDRFWY